jgi:hypothetical protein
MNFNVFTAAEPSIALSAIKLFVTLMLLNQMMFCHKSSRAVITIEFFGIFMTFQMSFKIFFADIFQTNFTLYFQLMVSFMVDQTQCWARS